MTIYLLASCLLQLPTGMKSILRMKNEDRRMQPSHLIADQYEGRVEYMAPLGLHLNITKINLTRKLTMARRILDPTTLIEDRATQ